jgi:hypothetical protein
LGIGDPLMQNKFDRTYQSSEVYDPINGFHKKDFTLRPNYVPYVYSIDSTEHFLSYFESSTEKLKNLFPNFNRFVIHNAEEPFNIPYFLNQPSIPDPLRFLNFYLFQPDQTLNTLLSSILKETITIDEYQWWRKSSNNQAEEIYDCNTQLLPVKLH